MTEENEQSSEIMVIINSSKIEEMEQIISGIDVKNRDSAELALQMTMQARKIKNSLEESRKNITKPYFDYQKSINKMASDVKDRLESIEKHLKSKIDEWILTEEDNPFGRIETLEVEDGKLFTTKSWDFTIEDPCQIPSEYLKIDESKIQRDVKLGIRNIPGVKIFEVKKTELRVKNEDLK